MATIATAASISRRIAANLLRAAVAATTPVVEAPVEVPAVIETPTASATRGAALFDVLGADADEADRLDAQFMAAATGTPVETVKPAGQVATDTVKPAEVPADALLSRVKPAPAREFYAPADMPTVETIEVEALAFDKAAEKYRAGDRGKNRARKLLDKVPAGRYGRALVEWVPSNTDRADLDEIARIFEEHKLGPVPMKRDRDSLKVTILPA